MQHARFKGASSRLSENNARVSLARLGLHVPEANSSVMFPRYTLRHGE
jgi:hypothetical protein